MLNFSTVATLFRMEMRMVVRDRRMLLLSLLVPLLVTPLMFWGSTWTMKKREKKLQTMTCLYAVTGPEAKAVRVILERARERARGTNAVRFQFREIREPDPLVALAKGELHLVIEAVGDAGSLKSPAGTNDFNETSKPGARQAANEGLSGEQPVKGALVLRLLFRGDHDDSTAALNRMDEALRSERRESRSELLKGAGFPIRVIDLGVAHDVDTASKSQVAGLRLGRVLTVLLLFFILSSGAVVATDSLAGEKERGTLETLLTTAASRVEILAAKQLVILGVALLITIVQGLNLLVYISFNLLPLPANLSSAVPPWAVALLFVLYLPVAALAGNVLLLISGYARSYKEAQMYFLPAMLLGVAPALASFLPGLPLRSLIAVVPVANIAVSVREILAGSLDWPFITLSWVVTAAAALWSMRLGVRFLATEKLITVSGADAVEHTGGPALFERRVAWWFVLLWATLILVNNYIGKADIRLQLCINLLVLFFGATVLMLRRYRLDPRQALALRTPRAAVWLGVLVGVPGGLLTALGLARLSTLLLPIPGRVTESFGESIVSANVPFWQLIFFMTVMPGLFEELAFRGMLLHGLRRRLRPVPLALVVGLAFGVFHVALFRFVPTACLGVLLAGVTLLTGSIFPAMAWHALSNGLALLAQVTGFSDTGLDLPCYLCGAGLLGVAFWTFYRHRTPYPGLRKFQP